jgi:hypothetical protein
MRFPLRFRRHWRRTFQEPLNFFPMLASALGGVTLWRLFVWLHSGSSPGWVWTPVIVVSILLKLTWEHNYSAPHTVVVNELDDSITSFNGYGQPLAEFSGHGIERQLAVVRDEYAGVKVIKVPVNWLSDEGVRPIWLR